MYCLSSDASVQLNARFVRLQQVTCPVMDDGQPMPRCFDEAGTYFGALSIRVRGGEHIRVEGGSVKAGFANVTIGHVDTGDRAALHEGERERRIYGRGIRRRDGG